MKKLIILLLVVFSLTGCGSTEDQINGTTRNWVAITDNLAYDSYSHVIYIDNYTRNGYSTYTTYLDANGSVILYDGQAIDFKPIEINDVIVYDKNTKIVYYANYTSNGHYVYTVYYDKNCSVCYYDTEEKLVKPLISNTEIPIN